MTENEAKYTIIEYMPVMGFPKYRQALRMAIQALEEIQQYRAIGTVEQLEWCKDASHWKELFKEKLEQYEAIGTIEEFKALKEKSVAKKPSAIISRMNGKYGKCPICNCNVVRVPYCERCGQKLSWQ